MIDISSIKITVEQINIKVIEYYKESMDSYKIELNILEQYPDFYDKYPFLVKKICKGDDLTILYKMIDNIELVNSGKESLSNVEHKLGEELAETYLYSNKDLKEDSKDDSKEDSKEDSLTN